jgi:putative copper export protein
MHMFGVIVWLGGLMFQSAVMVPIVQQEEHHDVNVSMRKVTKRFVGFVWMSVWTVFITGVLLMLFSPRFQWFQFHDRWSVLLLVKQVLFVLMVLYAFGYARMLHYLEQPSSNGGYDEKAHLYLQRLNQFRTISIVLGISALLVAAGMR